MADDLTNILAGSERADLHAMLDLLLDTADPDTGAVDAARYWAFAHVLADGRGIADELNVAAASIIAKVGIPRDMAELFKKWQGAILFSVLKRLNIKGEGSILPDSFNTESVLGFAHNLSGRTPRMPDLLSPKGTDFGHEPMKNLAQRCLVAAVIYYAEKHNVSESEARRKVLPIEGHPTPADREKKGFYSTWLRWKIGAKERGAIDDVMDVVAVEVVTGQAPGTPYNATADQIAEWWSYATARRVK